MQLRAVLSTLLLTVGLAHGQSIDPAPRGLGLPPPLSVSAILFLSEQPAVLQLALGFSVRTP